jgi:hypothetical protein
MSKIVYWTGVFIRECQEQNFLCTLSLGKRGFIYLSPERMQNLFHREQELPQGRVTKRKKERIM